MSSDWVRTTLGEVVSLKTGKLDSNEAQEHGIYPFFTCSPTTLAIDNFAFDTEAVILAGNNANGVFATKYYQGKFNAYQRTYVLEPLSPRGVSCKYLYYVISDLVSHLQELSIGSATKFLTKTILNALPIHLPARNEQDRIEKLLSSIDDRITLLRETNTTLEAIARALFKSWFVDFDPVRAKMDGRVPEGMDEETAALFPDGFEESRLGLVPKGWESSTLGQAAVKIFSGGTPDTRVPEYWQGDFPWFSSGETRHSVVVSCEKHISQEAVENSSTKRADIGDILIASAGQGHTRGQTSMCFLKTYINQSVIAVRAEPTICTSAWLYCNLARRYEEMRAISDSHSSRGSLTTKLIAGLHLVIPPMSVMQRFEDVAYACFESVAENQRRAKTLATLRDTLLPRFMSGQLRLPEAESLIAEHSA